MNPGAPIVSSCPRPRSIEARSLQLGVSASLVIAAAGLVAYGLSGSDALLLDGLNSCVMAGSPLLAAMVMVEPIRQFRRALGQTTGAAGDPALIPPVRARVEALPDLSLLKVGRTTFLVAYLDPHRSVDGRWIDALRERVQPAAATCSAPCAPS